jgi:hypothetical protein
MKSNLVSIPLMLFLSVLQTAVVSRIKLVNGSADLILIAVAIWGVLQTGSNVWIWAIIGGLFITISSAMPPFLPVIPYVIIGLLARGLHRRVWQVPLVASILMVLIGTIIKHIFDILVLQFIGIDINFLIGMRSVTIPSVFLNFLFTIPMYVLIFDISKWIEPQVEYE